MPHIIINKEKCKGCLLCLSVCPKGVIVIDTQINQYGTKPVKVKAGSVCIGCTLCAVICPDCCIEVYT